MRRIATLLAAALLFIVSTARAEQPRGDRFPTLGEQIAAAHATPGSALEKLIRENQDFSRLQPRDMKDRIVPPWLKVFWQKAHPEVNYDTTDPTGGYPLVLKEIYEWMQTHQDFKPGLPEANLPPGRQVGDRDEDTERFNPMAAISPLAATAGTNVRTSGAQSSARSESDIRINFWNPNLIIAASNNISSSGTQGQYYSTDGGSTWGQTTLSLASGDAFQSDPTVDWQSNGTAWSITMGISSNQNVLKVQAYKSTNNGASWSFDGTVSGTQSNTDKEMIWVDHSASSAYKDNLYVIWHNGNPAYMNRRTSSGWGTPIQVSNSSQTGTCIGADVKTNANGDVFGFFPDTGSSGMYVVKSTNGGSSYASPVHMATTYRSYDIGIPADNSRRVLIYVSGGAYRTSSVNNVFAVWNDLSGASGCNSSSNEPGSSVTSTCKTRIWFTRSTDGGSTFAAPVKLNDQSSLNDQFNPFLAVDETNGNVGVIYYDTVNDPNRVKTDVFYQLSTDGGATFQSAVKVTTAMTDETSSGADSGNQYGDYNSLSGYASKFFPSWTDRRSGGYEEIWTAPISTGSTTTYAISGNAGTTGATVSTSGGSATSDASNSYTISGLAAGTYTVTPSKSGCTFTPASQSVTITSANVTGVNFTASCTTPTYSVSGNAGTASASVSNGSTSVTASSTGAFSFASMANGTYTITPSKSGCTFSPASSSVTVNGANVSGVNFTASCGTTTGGLVNGNFETGSLSPWTATGVSSVLSSGAHGGTYAAQLGSTSPSTDSTLAQTFTLPSNAGNLSFYVKVTCPDTLTYDWVTATLKDNVTAATTTVLAKTCSNTGAWQNVSTSVSASAGHSVTLTLANHDDNYSGDATYSAWDDVTVSTTTPTYSISGSAGTSAATVSTTGASATSDASNNYTLAGLASGTYTVTPGKAGCTFSPASQSVTVGTANVTGINFTATCTGPTTLLSDGFEAAGWTAVDTSGTAGNWTIVTSSSYPSISAHGGTHWADFNSYTSSSGSKTRFQRTATLTIPSSYTTVKLNFWMYHDTGYSSYNDQVQAQVGVGTSWTNVGSAVSRYNGTTGWAQVSVDISTYKGQTISLGFLGISGYGNDEYLDDVTVTAQ